jgi:isopenicillin N synthase-like dioxygenase
MHRVVAMEKVDRYSIPFFFNPSYETTVSPFTNNNEKSVYHSINWGDFRRQRADGDYADVGKEIQISDYLIQS